MIWSIIPESVIFSGAVPAEQLRQIDYCGRMVMVRMDAQQCARVVKLLSTDPADFLLPQLQPGAAIVIR